MRLIASAEAAFRNSVATGLTRVSTVDGAFRGGLALLSVFGLPAEGKPTLAAGVLVEPITRSQAKLYVEAEEQIIRLSRAARRGHVSSWQSRGPTKYGGAVKVSVPVGLLHSTQILPGSHCDGVLVVAGLTEAECETVALLVAKENNLACATGDVVAASNNWLSAQFL